MKASRADLYNTLRASLEAQFATGKIFFDKLREKGEPYRFERWDVDTNGKLCMYYSFASRGGDRRNEKRIPLPELVAALDVLARTGALTRPVFKATCPVAQSAGPCGFAVAGRCLELLGVANYAGSRFGFRLVDKDRALGLLGAVGR